MASSDFDMKKIAEQLKKDGIPLGVEDLNKYIRKKGLITRVHIGGKTCEFSIDPKIFGVDVEKENSGEFWKNYVRQSKISLLPREYISKIKAPMMRVRQRLIQKTIGYNNSFMLVDDFEDFKKYVDEQREEMMNIVRSVSGEWDRLVYEFSNTLDGFMAEINSTDADVKQKIMDSIPSKETFIDSFYMRISVKTFPVAENLDIFDESVRKDIENEMMRDATRLYYDITGSALSKAFDALNSIDQKGIGDKKGTRLLEKAKKTIDELSSRNTFNNVNLTEIIKSANDALNVPELMLSESVEAVMARIYSYAVSTGTADAIDLSGCQFDKETLLSISKVL